MTWRTVQSPTYLVKEKQNLSAHTSARSTTVFVSSVVLTDELPNDSFVGSGLIGVAEQDADSMSDAAVRQKIRVRDGQLQEDINRENSG